MVNRSPPQPATAIRKSHRCVFVAHLHVRKCGGTAARKLFEGMRDAGWEQSGNSCSPMAAHLSTEPNGKKWSETHCDENIFRFDESVARLREKLAPEGCKVVSTLLLRDAVDQAVSEWAFFRADADKMSTHTPLEWAEAEPESMLRLLSPDVHQRARHVAFEGGCEEALRPIREVVARLDVVGVMDTPQDFAHWWL